MIEFKQHLIVHDKLIKEALSRLNELGPDAILFVVNEKEQLVGSLTDGDVRRGFLRGLKFENSVIEFVQPNPKYLKRSGYTIENVIQHRSNGLKIIPIIDDDRRVVDVLNFRLQRSFLPIVAVIMAGGRGERLRPLTDHFPKPLLEVGGKPIISYCINNMVNYGISNIWIAIRYLGNSIKSALGNGSSLSAQINYVEENNPLGTIGAVSLIDDIKQPYVLVSNSDLLTNVNYEDFFIDFVNQDAHLSVLTIPYTVSIPYAVLETVERRVTSFKEKPTYTYYSNGGIYLFKKEIIDFIPKNKFYNATDLMELLIDKGFKVVSYPLHTYWLDIGRHEDFIKAQNEVKHLQL